MSSLRGTSSSYWSSAVDAEVDPWAGCLRSTVITEKPAPVSASETSAPVMPAPTMATSHRRSPGNGGGTSPTPLQRSQKACGEVRSKVLRFPVRQSPQRFQSLAVPDTCLGHRIAQPLHRLIIHSAIHRIRMSVLATVRETETRRITHARRRSVHDVGDQRQCPHRFWTNAGYRQQLFVILWTRFVGAEHDLAQMRRIYVLLYVDPVTCRQRHRDDARELLVDDPRRLSCKFRGYRSRRRRFGRHHVEHELP